MVDFLKGVARDARKLGLTTQQFLDMDVDIQVSHRDGAVEVKMEQAGRGVGRLYADRAEVIPVLKITGK